MKRYVVKTGFVNAMGNSDFTGAGDGVEFTTREELIEALKEWAFSYTTAPVKTKKNILKAFDEAVKTGENSTAYESGYWTEASGYDPENSGYKKYSERNTVLITVDVKEED